MNTYVCVDGFVQGIAISKNVTNTHTYTLKRYYYCYGIRNGFLNRILCIDVNEFDLQFYEVEYNIITTTTPILFNNIIIKRNLSLKVLVL